MFRHQSSDYNSVAENYKIVALIFQLIFAEQQARIESKIWQQTLNSINSLHIFMASNLSTRMWPMTPNYSTIAADLHELPFFAHTLPHTLLHTNVGSNFGCCTIATLYVRALPRWHQNLQNCKDFAWELTLLPELLTENFAVALWKARNTPDMSQEMLWVRKSAAPAAFRVPTNLYLAPRFDLMRLQPLKVHLNLSQSNLMSSYVIHLSLHRSAHPSIQRSVTS